MRIQLGMDFAEAVCAMAEGNVGAVSAMIELVKARPIVDPMSGCQGILALCELDDLGFYGPAIWIFFKDICDQDTKKMITLLRADQLGFLPKDSLRVEVLNRANGIIRLNVEQPFNFNQLLEAVQAEIPRFATDIQ